jgi:Putative bacterial sensory transduction regulator
MTPGSTAAATRVVETSLAEMGVPVERPNDHTFVVTLEGERKLRTTVSLVVGDHALSINAFVARRPDEEAEAVYRWLLERNRRMYAVAFCIDHLGDIYLSGRVSLDSVTREEVDRILGCVAEYSDGSFNTILELGFATAIRREWKWRVDRGEPTGNLEAFRHLAEHAD